MTRRFSKLLLVVPVAGFLAPAARAAEPFKMFIEPGMFLEGKARAYFTGKNLLFMHQAGETGFSRFRLK